MDGMSDLDKDYSDEVYGDTDPNNPPDGEANQGASAGDGLPGVPVDGYPGWRAGVPGASNLLGLVRTSDLVARPGDDPPARLQLGTGGGDPRLILASDPRTSTPTLASDGREGYPMPKAYMPDGHGGVQLRPDFAAAHPNGPLDFGGMAKEIDWSGVYKGLRDILGGVANSEIHDWVGEKLGLPPWIDVPRLGPEAWKAQDEANKNPGKPAPGVDRVTNGLP
jgi:hypothetical protein